MTIFHRTTLSSRKRSVPHHVRTGIVVAVLLVAAAGCRRGALNVASPSIRAAYPPQLANADVSSLSASALGAILVCADSLGRTDGLVVQNRCAPCVPLALMGNATLAVAHARDLWDRRARAAYTSSELGPSCINIAWKFATQLRPHDTALRVEYTLFKLKSAESAVRDSALSRHDRLLDSLTTAGQLDLVQRLRVQFAVEIWRRAQLLLERPLAVARDRVEVAVRTLTPPPNGWRALPAPPPISDTIGVSEAQWAARLHDQIAKSASTPVLRSHWHRLTLAPWVALGFWQQLDSIATALLERAPGDSAVLPARALARYKQMRNAVWESPVIMAQFDSALRAMPRADSLRYDTFDGVLTASDDEWRYGFLPTDRKQLDLRGWAVLDPLWSTPVNEVLLERRARVAEADYRYADQTAPGEAGSETAAGQLLIRLGPPDARWRATDLSDGRLILTRGWPLLQQSLFVEASRSNWMIFSHQRFSAQALARMPLVRRPALTPQAQRGRRGVPSVPAECTDLVTTPTVLRCGLARSSQWDGVPFYRSIDTIDVTAARFRIGRDSVHMYLGAAVPVRSFKTATQRGATRADRLILSAWLADPVGRVLYSADDPRPLPTGSESHLTAQWTPRLAAGSVMHRVEALEPTRPSAARGAAALTSDAQVVFPLRGFGMSDVLVAASTTNTRQQFARWTDIRFVPNGAAIRPRDMFSLTWEVYDLEPAPDGRVRWSVEIRRERGDPVTRGGIRGVLANSQRAGARVIADEAQAPAVAYTRDAPAAAVVVDHLSTFNLGDAPPGRHVIEVTIRDLVSGKTVARGVVIRLRAKS